MNYSIEQQKILQISIAKPDHHRVSGAANPEPLCGDADNFECIGAAANGC
jgi:hypothetical protein